jgi:formate dehydrogenase major subunit
MNRNRISARPKVRSDVAVTLTIDGRAVTVPAGTSVMRAAAECGGSIPKLCATDSVKAFGSCRHVPGRSGGHARHARQLHHAGGEGMVVHTQTPRLQRLRKG